MVVASLAACEKTEPTKDTEATTEEPTTEEPTTEPDPELSEDDKLFEAILGEYYKYYQEADVITDDIAKRYALFAIAEAKLLEANIMIPTSSKGGAYAISRVVPYSVSPALWGNDAYRYHNILVVAGDPLTKEERDEVKALYAELKGTGTFYAKAQEYILGQGHTFKDTYTRVYSSDPETWDQFATYYAADTEAIINTYDNLFEYDQENELQPALATGYTVSDDGLTYTFTLREGVKWVDSQGRELADVQADDFVAGMQHLLDAKGGLESLLYGLVVNAQEYAEGEIADFGEVGIKAVDAKTLEVTLAGPCAYFNTMWTYNLFVPLCREYYASQGGKFGAEFDAEAEDYLYGTDPDHIAYCGPYLVTNATEKNTIVFSANPTYWNKDNITVKTITWLYNDGTDETKSYNDMKSETIDGCTLNVSTTATAKQEGLFDKYAYVSATDATAYMVFTNVNRQTFANANDATKAVSPQTEEDAARTKAAMQNLHFRRALAFAFDRGAYNAVDVGEDIKYFSLINSYTPGTFVALPEETTVTINGTEKTYPAGTYYGQIVQDQIDADGVKIKVWDPTADAGIGSSAGFDGWFNVENALEEIQLAIEELKAEGVEVTAENPIQLDVVHYSSASRWVNLNNVLKQSLETNLNGLVQVNLVEVTAAMDWYYACYYTSSGAESNFDLNNLSGWGPDYGDPQTYVHTFLPEIGDMIKNLGLY